MWKEMKDRTISLKKIKNCLKLYLSFDCWVNEPHPWSQVTQSSEALGILINLIKECFPRDEGWGWNLPKMHAFAKMPHIMLKFGSANNFSGNIGEQALKGIVKDRAEKKTQRQPDKFAEQCAMCGYESNVIKYVMTDISSQFGVSTHSSNPFGDLKYGLLVSVPEEMLHASGTGLLKHMFGCLDNLIGGPNSKKR